MHRQPKTPLKTRPRDLESFKEFAETRANLLLCVETSFITQDEVREVIKRDFPTAEIVVFIREKYVGVLTILLRDRTVLEAFLNSDWLLAGVTTIKAGSGEFPS